MTAAGESLSQGSCSRAAPEEIQNSGMCSSSGSTHLSVNGGRSASALGACSKEDRRCRKWRGRRQSVEAKDYVEALWGSSDCREPKNAGEASDMDGSAILTDTKMVFYLSNIDLDVLYAKYIHTYICCGMLWNVVAIAEIPIC